MATGENQEFDDLHHLIKKGDRVKMRAWMSAGGDPNLRNKFGWSLLMLAALRGRTDMVEDLLAAGAKTNLNAHKRKIYDWMRRGQRITWH